MSKRKTPSSRKGRTPPPQQDAALTQQDAALSRSKRARLRSMLVIRGLLAISALVCVIGVSRAWYVINRDVDAHNAQIKSNEASPALFLTQGEDGDFLCAIATEWETTAENGLLPLYPISTADCENWYYISDWAEQAVKTDNVTRSTFVASGYTQANFAGVDGQYTGLGGTPRRAYYHNSYTLYTNTGALDIYLNPTNPIDVVYSGDRVGANLLNAIRVGVVVGGALKFIYAPVAEAGGQYTGVNGATATANLNETVKVGAAGLGAYLAAAGESPRFTAPAGAVSLGSANAGGLPVDVYVWLEGTDADAVVGTADNDGALSVTVNFVGVEPAAAP